MKIHIIYPENRLVSSEQIWSWFNDAVENGECASIADFNPPSKDLEVAAFSLQDAGLITLHRNWRVGEDLLP
jgi:hypothetical protein